MRYSSEVNNIHELHEATRMRQISTHGLTKAKLLQHLILAWAGRPDLLNWVLHRAAGAGTRSPGPLNPLAHRSLDNASATLKSSEIMPSRPISSTTRATTDRVTASWHSHVEISLTAHALHTFNVFTNNYHILSDILILLFSCSGPLLTAQIEILVHLVQTCPTSQILLLRPR